MDAGRRHAGGRLLWLVALVIQVCSTAAWAQGLQVTPITILFGAGQMTTTLTVVNGNPTTASLQLRPLAWDQTNGADRLSSTTELAVSPPIIDVAPGQAQTFRLVLRRGPSAREASYRLLLDQLPSAAAAGSVRVMIRLSLPVFAAPADSAQANLAWRISVDQNGARLTGVNNGNIHIRVIDAALTQNGQKIPLAASTGPYILAGAERTWRILAPNQLRTDVTAHLIAKSDGGPINAMVRVSSP